MSIEERDCHILANRMIRTAKEHRSEARRVMDSLSCGSENSHYRLVDQEYDFHTAMAEAIDRWVIGG